MIRRAALLVLGALAVMPARASMEDDGVWAAGVWATTVFADGVWYEDNLIAVPNVVGQASAAAADAILEGDGLDLGGATARCSPETLDAVVGQSPAAGTQVALGSLVDVLVSNGVECVNGGRNGVRIRGLRMPGL